MYYKNCCFYLKQPYLFWPASFDCLLHFISLFSIMSKNKILSDFAVLSITCIRPNVFFDNCKYGCNCIVVYWFTSCKGCQYGDLDPDNCATLMSDNKGTSNCYDSVTQTQCCDTCDKLKDTSTPSKYILDTKTSKYSLLPS